MVDRKLNDTTYASYTDFIWALPDNADLRIQHGTTSSCDKVSFVDVFSPCLVSRQYKQSERSTTRTKNRGSLKVWNSIVESWIQIQIFKLDLVYDERTSEILCSLGVQSEIKTVCIYVYKWIPSRTVVHHFGSFSTTISLLYTIGKPDF